MVVGCVGFLLFYFIGGAMHHAFGFAGIHAHKSEIWHGFYLLMCVAGIFSVLSRREIGFWWLLTGFLWQIPVEVKGTVLSYGSDMFSDQIIEVILNLVGVFCLWRIKPNFFLKES